jgi:hypothetical protein
MRIRMACLSAVLAAVPASEFVAAQNVEPRAGFDDVQVGHRWAKPPIRPGASRAVVDTRNQ